MTLRVPTAWESSFEDSDTLVFVAAEVTDRWETVEAELRHAFDLTQDAARSGYPIVYVVHNDDLLGRRGAGKAMVATGLLSAARTAALELAKAGVPVNVLAIDDTTDPGAVARWVVTLSEHSTPTGELIHLGSGHIGKALA